ncbi:MAG: hypothetical protein ACLRPW_11985 [Intestinibacter sp.]
MGLKTIQTISFLLSKVRKVLL